MLGEGEKSSFHFDDRCFIGIDVFFVLTLASVFYNSFFMEVQSRLSGVSEQ